MVLAAADTYLSPARIASPTEATTGTPATVELTACLTTISYAPPATIPLDVWVAHGRTLARRATRLQWLIADWCHAGVDYYGPSAWPYLVSIAGLDAGTLKKMIGVARRFPLERRRPGLPFSRYSAVAALPADVADRLLARAERENWVQQDLVRAIRAYRGQPSGPKPKRRARLAAPTATTTTVVVTPDVTDYRQTAPIRCGSCWLVVGYAVGTRAVMSTGPATVQRVADGRLVMNAECTSCKSTTLVALSALEIPTSAGLAAGAG